MKNEMLEKLMAKKKNQEPLDENYKQAKMSMLQALHGEMGKMMGDHLKGQKDGIKKVSVLSDSPEGLDKGLDQAKQMLHGGDPTSVEPDMEDGEEPGIEDHQMNDAENFDADQDEDAEEGHDDGEGGNDEENDLADKVSTLHDGLEDHEDAEKMVGNMINHEISEGELSPDKIDMLIELLQNKKLSMGKNL